MSNKRAIGLFAILTLVYLILALTGPIDKETLSHYHITTTQARELTAAVVIPFVLIWIVALYGALKMKGYAQIIKDSPDGQAINTISSGLLVLVFGLPITTIISNIFNQITSNHESYTPPLTIVNNYIGLLIMALGLLLISNGAQKLNFLIKKQVSSTEQKVWVLISVIISGLYAYIIAAPSLHGSLDKSTYFMPGWLALITLVIPYVYFWYHGFYAAFCIHRYQKYVKGNIYKNSLNYIAAGISVVVATSIFIRFLVNISEKLNRLSLSPILLIIYIFILISAIGYILIAIGAKKLRRIEEV